MMKAHPSINLPQTFPLWGDQTPYASEEDGDFPRFTYYLPSGEYRTGASVLILPGGGYGLVSTAKEGHRPAMLLSSHGIACAVLEYRHFPQRHPVPLLDAQRGMRLLRFLAREHGLADDCVGVMGFSAGGHLAGSVATQPEVKAGCIGDDLDEVGYAPDFAALLYPVVSMTESWSHGGSRTNLLGEDADPGLSIQLSIERAVSSATPPMFLFHTQEDAAVPVQNSLRLAEALTEAGVDTELHVYAKGVHGFGLDQNHPWGRLLISWLSLRVEERCGKS